MALIRTVAAVIANDRGEVLLVRKRGSAIFIQPGGKAEAGEPPVETLRRELREELGVALVDAGIVRLGEFEDDAVHEVGQRVRTQAYVCAVRGSPRPLAEIETLAWVDPAGPHAVNVAPLSARHVLPAYAAWRRGGHSGALP